MFHHSSSVLLQAVTKLLLFKSEILRLWISDMEVMRILQGHSISPEAFRDQYASGVFDFFFDVLKAKIEVGNCPVIGTFLEYLKDREISAEELFIICSQFRQCIIDYAVRVSEDPVRLSKELSQVFDRNFAGVLKNYTDTIFQKDQEIAKNVKLLGEYKKAIDESAIVSKTNINAIITFVNNNFIKRCGYSEKELIGTRHSIVWDDEESVDLLNRIHKKMKLGKVFHETVKNRKKYGVN
ncbi:MAG: PAS domain-containing protein [Campylobacterota bacterium]|nr:PAS domain-containing protein [Campylobacterota bacterium]